jgi:hypothetical protein
LPLCVLPHCCLSIHFAIDQKTHLQKKLVIVAAIEHFNFQRLGNILLWFIWSSNILYRRKVNTLKVLCRCLWIAIWILIPKYDLQLKVYDST